MDITSTIDLLPLRARKQTLKGLVGLLNQSIIGYARAHLRQVRFAAPGEVPTIDLYNEMRAREHDHEQHKQAIADMGYTPPEDPIVQLMRVTILRDWFELEIAQTNEGVAFDPQWDAPFSVADSLDWNIERAPTYDDAEIRKNAIACGRPFEQLRAARMAAENDDKKELEASRDAILDLYETCSAANLATRQFVYSITVRDEDGEERPEQRVVDIPPIEQREGIEALLDELPVQLRWRIGIKLFDLMGDQAERAIRQLVRPGGRGSRDAAADIRLIDAARVAHWQQLAAFDKQYGSALDELANGRGLYIKELPLMEEQPIVTAMDAQRAKEDAAALAASGEEDIRLDAKLPPKPADMAALLRRSPVDPRTPTAFEQATQAALDRFDEARGGDPLP